MPIYDFKCTKCNYEQELLAKMDERDNKNKCPECGKHKSFRMIMSKPAKFRWGK